MPIQFPFAHNRPIVRSTPIRTDVPPDGSTDARLGRIVRLLSDNATVVISGTRIAEELGTTRSEVWRAVQHLRELGLQITGHPATGYQMETVPDLLLPDILRPLVKGTIFGSRIHHYFSIGSTNVAAMKAGSDGEPEGAIFLAEEQTGGRGRAGHTWESAQSVGIYCSVVLRPVLSPADALMLSLIAGIAVAEAVERTTGLHPDLRWPNDVMLNERKFCGILTEMNSEPTRVHYVVVGIGINVNHASFVGRAGTDCDFAAHGERTHLVARRAGCCSAKIPRQRISQAHARRPGGALFHPAKIRRGFLVRPLATRAR